MVSTLLRIVRTRPTWQRMPVLMLLYAFAMAANAASSVRLTTETPEIYVNDAVVIEIEAIGLVEPLDLSPLEVQLSFQRETTGTRIAVVQGKVVEIALRRMEFLATQTGAFVLGPLTAQTTDGLTTSNTISVNVLPAPQTVWQPEGDDAIVSISTSRANPYVGEQMVLELILEHQYAIADETIVLPSLSLFDVVPIHEERRTIDNETGIRKISWRYLVHPRNSGIATLAGFQWSGTMNRSRTQRARFERTIEPLQVSVRPAPTSDHQWWLPASSVTLEENWSKDVRTLTAGNEIEREISIVADGVLASQLPVIEPLESRSIQSALISTHRTHKLIGNSTRATGIYTFRLTAMSPVPVFLDTVRVPWWNVQTAEADETILPARRINVGLPDRADLLAEIATRESLADRWIFRLQSIQSWHYLTVPILALSVVVLLSRRSRAFFRKRYQLLQRYRLRRQLKTACAQNQWNLLYETIQSTIPEELNTEASAALLKKLEPILFSGHESSKNVTSQITSKDIDALFSKRRSTRTIGALPLAEL